VSALNRRGNVLQAGGRPQEAVQAFGEALALAPGIAALWGNLGSAWLLCRQPPKAVEAYRRALALAEHDDGIRVRLALALIAQAQLGRSTGTVEPLKQASALLGAMRTPIAPELRELALLARVRILIELDADRARAQSVCEELLQVAPDWVPALLAAADIAEAMSRPDEACTLLLQAVQAQPDDADLLARFIYSSQRDPATSSQARAQATRRHGQLLRAKVGAPAAVAPVSPARERRLTFGFVSGDYRRHPIASLVIGLFRALPRERVRVVAYSNHPANDDRTAEVRASVDEWRSIDKLDTAQACRQIRADEVDVLFDLSGLTGYHRLDVFARRAAPLQVSWLGFHTGTMLGTIDAHLADEQTSRGLQARFRERLVDLPWAMNQAAEAFPEVTPVLAQAPCERNGYLTFGSLNNPSKFSDAVFDQWAAILHRLPGARLAHRFGIFRDQSLVAAFRARFAARGIAEDRIACLPATPDFADALTWLAQTVDVGLDPFPYGSHTTGLQSLAVGVPVLSLYGEEIVGRICAVFHQRLGLTEFVVRNLDEYVERAVAIARSPERLAQLRREARARTLASPLTDEKAFAEIFERVVRGLWRERVSGEGRRREYQSR